LLPVSIKKSDGNEKRGSKAVCFYGVFEVKIGAEKFFKKNKKKICRIKNKEYLCSRFSKERRIRKESSKIG
jgi:hypothetical protein